MFQGDAREARSNYLLGEFVLDGLPEGPRGHAKVRVSFGIDADGMVNVTATASETGSTKQMRVESSSNMSRGEVESLKFESASEGSADDASGAEEPDDFLQEGPSFEYEDDDDFLLDDDDLDVG